MPVSVLATLLGFVAVSTAFSLRVPLFEAPDEPSHAAMVRYLQTYRALPVQQPPDDFPAGQEGSQPPLYYALGAALLSLSPEPVLAPRWAEHNPDVTFNRERQPRENRNLYAHTARADFPYQGDVLGIHLVRLLSVVLGAGTVLLTFLTARELFPGRPLVAGLAPALVAFNPQFVFISGVVNNDVAIAAAATLVIWWLVRWHRRGGSDRRAVVLGLALGIALLTKLSAGLLVVPIAAVLLADFLDHRRLGVLLRRGLIAGLIAAGLAGWWFLRNQVLYGDPLGWQAMLAAAGEMTRSAPLDMFEAARVLWQSRGTYWGAFGWTNLFFDDQVYQALDLLVALALVGLVVGVARVLAQFRVGGSDGSRRGTVVLAVLILWPVVVLIGLVRWVQLNEAANQGRLLFPAIGAIAILLALGVDELRASLPYPLSKVTSPPNPLSTRWRGGLGVRFVSLLSVGLTLAGAGLNLRVLTAEIVPVYQPIFESGIQGGPSPVLRFGDAVELLEYHWQPGTLAPGDALDLELVWRAVRPVDRNWSVSLVLGNFGAPFAQARSWPQGGRAATTAWPVGQVVRDRYRLAPRWEGGEPQLADIWLGLYEPLVAGPPRLPVADAAGKPLGDSTSLGRVKLRPRAAAEFRPSTPVSAQFGQAIGLLGYDLDQTSDRIALTLYWRAAAPPTESYTVFVHVVDDGGRKLAQRDSLPRGGSYPTAAWDPGEVVRDHHVLALSALPAGTYPVQIGLYRVETGKRLPVQAADLLVKDDALQLVDLKLPKRGAGWP